MTKRMSDKAAAAYRIGVDLAPASAELHYRLGLALRRDGRIAASMPLHGVEAVVSEMRWDATLTWVALVGDGVNYTYRIPEEVLRHRSAKAGTAVTGDV